MTQARIEIVIESSDGKDILFWRGEVMDRGRVTLTLPVTAATLINELNHTTEGTAHAHSAD